MKRTPVVLLASVFAIVAMNSWFARGGADDKPGTLPGARPTVDAAQYPSLQAAIDALPAEGGRILLPAGTFESSGTATHIKNVNTNGEPALIIRREAGIKDKTKRQWRVQLTNFRITGNEKSGHGILADYVNEIFLDGVTVSYHGGDGIRLDHCYEDPRVTSCLITYNKATGLNLIGCHDIVVASSQFEENMDALHCFDGFNLCMTGNCVDDHLGHGVVIENTYGSVVSGNMIEECNGTAIILDRDCYGITLSANIIAHDGGGIDLRDAHGCAVSANTFTIIAADALRIGPSSGRITVTGNNFSNSYIGEGKVRRSTNDMKASGLTLVGTSNVAVSGNLFADVEPKALAVDGKASRKVLFANNVLVGVKSDHEKLEDSKIENVLESDD
jgi:hypothetical protein